MLSPRIWREQFVTACEHAPKVLDFSTVKETPPDPESVTKAAPVKIGGFGMLFYFILYVLRCFSWLSGGSCP